MTRREMLTGIHHCRTASHVHPDVPSHDLPEYLYISCCFYRDSCRATTDHRSALVHCSRLVYNVREALKESLHGVRATDTIIN